MAAESQTVVVTDDLDIEREVVETRSKQSQTVTERAFVNIPQRVWEWDVREFHAVFKRTRADNLYWVGEYKWRESLTVTENMVVDGL